MLCTSKVLIYVFIGRDCTQKKNPNEISAALATRVPKSVFSNSKASKENTPGQQNFVFKVICQNRRKCDI